MSQPSAVPLPPAARPASHHPVMPVPRAPETGFRPPRRLREVRVWAPAAERVTLSASAGDARLELAMATTGGGWWRVPHGFDHPLLDLSATGRPVDYTFAVDGGPARPDPRSVRLPAGVHGPSRLHAVDETIWTDQGWRGRPVNGAVLYELHVGTFTEAGTLDAAVARLDHLVELGVDFVELMPLNAFNGSHNWGYDGVGWYAVHEAYGGPDALARFVDAAHSRGLGVLLDVVYNHLGPSGNYLPEFGPYLSEVANPWGASVNLSGPDSDTPREFIVANALFWLREYHLDGLRLDAVHALADSRAVHILEELAIRTEELSHELDRPLALIAESDLNDPRIILPRSLGGYGLTAQWDDDIHHAIHTAVSGERQGYYADFGEFDGLAKVLRQGFFHDGTYSSFRRRRHGRPIPTDVLPASALVAYTCNHDQIGNRAIGDRPSAYLDGGQLAIKAALVLLGPFTPMLFMGEEWAAGTPFQYFTSHPEPELGEATAAGRKAEFADHGWAAEEIPDPQAPATFTDSRLDWTELEQADHRRMLDFYRSLIALRRTVPDFADGRFAGVEVDFDAGAGWLIMHRGEHSVVVNIAGREVSVPIRLSAMLSWEEQQTSPDRLRLTGHNVVVGRRIP